MQREKWAGKDVMLYSPVEANEKWYAPRHHYDGDAGYDLTCSRDVVVASQGFAQVPTNLKVALPPGMWCMLIGRSSTFFKRNLIVNPGIIDNGWRGELLAIVYNPSPKRVVVKEGERIIQLIPFNLHTPRPEMCDGDFPFGGRGENGFGSTGNR